MSSVAQIIESGQTAIGIELGSTRIKAVLIDKQGNVLASGGFDWENSFENRIWTYPLELVWKGLAEAYGSLAADVQSKYGVALATTGAIGVSAMMHGYLVFDSEGNQLVPFRTWRNAMTEDAASRLTDLFSFNIPQRWSAAHLAHAIMGGEPHVAQIAHMTTLAGLVHWRLTGRKVLGVGDASGMFPIDPATGTFDAAMLDAFDAEFSAAFPWKIRDILPEVLPAGAEAGALTEEGARLLDPSGTLAAGIPLAPPEGDAGTGMVATNAVQPGTGNTSAGTSIFTMVVMERPLKDVHVEIDVVNTPAGHPVAMVHCNNGASEVNAWAGVFSEFAKALGAEADTGAVFKALFESSLAAEPDCGGLLSYNYLSGEVLTGLSEGRPLVLRTPDSHLNLANFMRSQIYAIYGTLAIGMRILEAEDIELTSMLAHGGLFKTKGVAQAALAAALNSPVAVSQTAGEGGAWGMAVLAAYLGDERTLSDYLDQAIFAGAEIDVVEPDPKLVEGFARYLKAYERALPVMRAAVAYS
ncbi:MAG: ATPase [Propionibacteriaceae bacterium]|jgi:sugar (pentulose or hexulose) kinase|nr:ATPase [Propionibacteriaceae bacterium]